MLRYVSLIVLFVVLNTHGAFCAVEAPTPKRPLVVKFDSVSVEKKSFDQPALREYLKQEDFQYDDAYQGISLWERFWRWFWSFFDGKDATVVGTIINYTILALGVAGIIFLILKLAGVNPLWVLQGKAKDASLAYSEHTENIHQLNIDDEITRAISAGNYRLAVRMLYLQTLKQLNEAGLIHWDINKTNSQYSNELTNAEQRLQFNLLTLQFEYVWYGEFNIDAKVFEQVKALFNDFKVKAA